MVTLYTNQPAFFADLADELRLFRAMEEIQPAKRRRRRFLLFWKNREDFGWFARACAWMGRKQLLPIPTLP